jgi:ubiquinol-cytochrome c reductase cytochrome b subunit
LFITGAFLALYYSPYPGAAYDSVNFAQFDLPFGEVIRGVHYWSWNLLLVVIVLHMLRAFLMGAYKSPREMAWVSGVLALLIVPLFIITGDLLPWTQTGYWTTQVRSSIIASVPLVGSFLVQLLQGGPRIGVVALTRFYVVHVIFLPWLLLLLLAWHFTMVAGRGLADPLRGPEPEKPRVRLIPDFINRSLFFFTVVTLLIGIASHYFFPVSLGDPADPTDAEFVPKPEWWVLFLNKLVGIFKGPWSAVGSAIIPGALATLLLVLPFLDRSPERWPHRRWKSLLAALLLIVAILALSYSSYVEHYGRH